MDEDVRAARLPHHVGLERGQGVLEHASATEARDDDGGTRPCGKVAVVQPRLRFRQLHILL